jgi:hypothetical protein
MYRAVNSAAAEQGGVRCVDYCVHVKRRNIGKDGFHGWCFASQEASVKRANYSLAIFAL